MKRILMAVLAASLGVAGTQLTRPVQPVGAYNLMCCQYARTQAPHLVGAIWPQHDFDGSAWFKGAVINGFNAWNNQATAVFVSLEFTQDSNAQLLYWTDYSSSDSSTGGCGGTNGNGVCVFSILQLVEGPSGMQQGTPNYDQYTVAHEEGHGLGLDHSCVGGALMSGPAGPCQGQSYSCNGEANCVTVPQPDDVNGMVAMYGNGSNSSYTGGCSRPNSLPIKAQTSTTLTLPGSNWVTAAESAVAAARSQPAGFVEGLAVDAADATGKVVPYSRVPQVPVIKVPGTNREIDANPQPC